MRLVYRAVGGRRVLSLVGLPVRSDVRANSSLAAGCVPRRTYSAQLSRVKLWVRARRILPGQAESEPRKRSLLGPAKLHG